MKRMLLLICMILPISSQALGQDIYRTVDCGNAFKNPHADASAAMRNEVSAFFPTRAAAAGMIVTIGINNALRDMRKHRLDQCTALSLEKEYEANCPLGRTIVVDSYVSVALKQYAGKDNGSLQRILEQGLKDASAEAATMMKMCNDS